MKNIARAFCVLVMAIELGGFFHLLPINPTYTWLGLFITIIVVFLTIEWMNHTLIRRRIATGLHWSAWFLALIPLSIDAGGDIFHSYATYVGYDKVAHGIGGAIVCIVLIQFLRAWSKSEPTPYSHALQSILAVTVATSIGVLYEFEEYLEDVFTGSHRSGGPADTANDLLMNTLGILCVMLSVWLYRRFRKQKGSIIPTNSAPTRTITN